MISGLAWALRVTAPMPRQKASMTKTEDPSLTQPQEMSTTDIRSYAALFDDDLQARIRFKILLTDLPTH